MQSVFLIFYGWEMMRELQEPLNWAKIDTTLIFALFYTNFSVVPYLNTINLQKEVYYIIMHTLQPAPLLKHFFF